jgi:hypothetical protein
MMPASGESTSFSAADQRVPIGWAAVAWTDLDTFEKVASCLRDLAANGPVALRVVQPSTPSGVDFDIHFRDPEVISALEGIGVSRAEFREAMDDIEEVLSAAIQESSLSRRQENAKSEPSEVIEKKLEFVSSLFDLKDLRKRAWIKETSKAEVMLDAGWEVSVKTLDEARRPPNDQPVPFGLLAVTGSTVDNPLSALIDKTDLLLVADRADVKALSETLRRLDDALAAAEQKSKEGADA